MSLSRKVYFKLVNVVVTEKVCILYLIFVYIYFIMFIYSTSQKFGHTVFLMVTVQSVVVMKRV